jgi:DNA-binding HxlR family transcriptional regulator
MAGASNSAAFVSVSMARPLICATISAGTRSLRPGPAGFRELSRAIGGVSDSMLSERLSELTEAGLIVRIVEEGPPVAVSYKLAAPGLALMPALEQLSNWATEHLPSE